MTLLSDYQRLVARNEPIGRAVVTEVWGSAPRQPGAVMLATPSGATLGSVSGGCVESAVAEEIAASIANGTTRLVTYGVTNEDAWSVGLSCPSRIARPIRGTSSSGSGSRARRRCSTISATPP